MKKKTKHAFRSYFFISKYTSIQAWVRINTFIEAQKPNLRHGTDAGCDTQMLRASHVDLKNDRKDILAEQLA